MTAQARVFVEAEQAEGRNVVKACDLIDVSRSAFYQWQQHLPSARAVSDEELTGRIIDIHAASMGTYGMPRVHAELRAEGVHVGRKRVARLMVAAGLAGRCRRRTRRTTIADPETKALNVLNRVFGPENLALDTCWAGDITYVRTWQGWAYLATVIDLASRRVVGWALADRMEASLVCDAMRMAIVQRRPPPGLLFHSDRGSQYTSSEFRALLAANSMTQSLSRPGQCWDNSVSEAWFGTYKLELIEDRTWSSIAALRSATFEYIEVWYNQKRRHSSIHYFSPAAYEAQLIHQRQAAHAA
jgi:transposase InsO family protein